MRTPVILVAGQDHTDEVTGALLRRTGTVVVEHRFDGHVVRRMTATLSRGELITTEDALEFAHGCVSCTIRDDLLVLLRRLHRRDNVGRIVVHLAPWLEPQPSAGRSTTCGFASDTDTQTDQPRSTCGSRPW